MYDLLLQECFRYTLCGSKDSLGYDVSTDVLRPRCHIQGKFGSLLCAVVYLLRVHILCSSQQHLISGSSSGKSWRCVGCSGQLSPLFHKKSGPLIHLCRPNSSAGWSPLEAMSAGFNSVFTYRH